MAIIIKRGRQNASVIAQPTPIVRRFDFRLTERLLKTGDIIAATEQRVAQNERRFELTAVSKSTRGQGSCGDIDLRPL